MPNPNCPQIHQQFKQLLELKKEFEQASDLKNSERLMKELRSKLESAGGLLNIYRVTVNYRRSAQDMLARGKYNRIDQDITSEYFPYLLPEGKAESKLVFQLISFPKPMTLSEVVTALDDDKKILRTATHYELLAFAEKFPEKQREFPIISLGPLPSGDDMRMMCLYGDDSERKIDLRYAKRWSTRSHFLVVRK